MNIKLHYNKHSAFSKGESLMYNILIVDDDNLIREDLKTMTDWQKYGFQIIGDVSNGAQALNFIQFHDVDIIITDICMPIMDGVELIKTVKSIKPHIKFIVISNYDDFKYVKDAMKYGASDYILKYEIEEDNLLHLLNTVKDEIQHDSQAEMYKFEQLWRKILTEKNFNNKLYEESKKFKEFNNWKNFVIVILKCNSAAHTDTVYQLLQNNCSESIVVQMNEKQWCIIIWHNSNSWMYIRASIDQTVRRIFSDLQKYSIQPFAVVSNICTDISKISAVYSNALKYLHYNFYMGSGSVVYQDLQKDFSYELTPLKKLFDNLISCLISDRDPKVEKHLDCIFQHIQQKTTFRFFYMI